MPNIIVSCFKTFLNAHVYILINNLIYMQWCPLFCTLAVSTCRVSVMLGVSVGVYASYIVMQQI
jgi:hypothetical protein